MWKIILGVVIVAILDLRNIQLKEKKKEIVIYFIICIITLSLGIYYVTPNYVTLTEFLPKIMP